MRSRALALLLFATACDVALDDVSLGVSEQHIDPDVAPAPPAPWLHLPVSTPLDNPGESTAAYLPGSSEVTPTGAYTYKIPLEVPPGRAGMQPELALVYSSASTGNGPLGVGWSVTGVSSITRCGSSLSTEGFVDGIDFAPTTGDAAHDRFCLDGNKLALIAGTYGGHNSEYRTEANTFAKITAIASDDFGPTAFEVRLKNGRIRTYQARNRDRYRVGVNQYLTNDGPVRAFWALTSEKDRSGNEIQYLYQDRTIAQTGTAPLTQVVLDEIRYTAHGGLAAQRSVKFTYEDRADDEHAWASGIKSGLHLRIAAITMSAPNPVTVMPVWTYRFAFTASKSSKRSLLTSVERCAMQGGNPAGCTWKKELGWSQVGAMPTFTTTDLGDFPLVYSGPGFRRYDSQVFDANGDGADDLLLAEQDPYGGEPGDDDGVLAKVTMRLGSRTAPLAVPINVLGTAFPDSTRLASSRPMDLEGDGKVDLWATYSSDTRGPSFDFCAAKLLRWNTATSKFIDSGIADPEYTCGESKHVFLDWNGDRRLDRLSALDTWKAINIDEDEYVPGKWKLSLNTGSGFAAPTTSSLESACAARVADVDGDGRGELISARRDADDKCTIPTLLRGADQTHAMTVSSILPGEFLGTNYYIPPTAELGDFNGDGLEDALSFGAPANNLLPSTIRWNTGNGYTEPMATTGVPVSADARRGIMVADWNGDGRSDLLILTFTPSNYNGKALWWRIAISNGDGTFTPYDLQLPFATYQFDTDLVRLGDFNGDGYLDIAYVEENYANGVISHRLKVALQTPVIHDRIRAIKDGPTAWPREAIDYATAWSDTPEAPAAPCVYPMTCVTRRDRLLARAVTTRDHVVDPMGNVPVPGRTLYYSYEDPVADGIHGGFAFRKFRVWDPTRPREVITTFDPRAFTTAPLAPNGRRYPSMTRPTSVTSVTPLIRSDETLPAQGSKLARVERTTFTNTVRVLDGGKTFVVETPSKIERSWEQAVGVNQLLGERLTGVIQPTTPATRIDTTSGFDDYGNVTWQNRLSTGGIKSVKTFAYDNRVGDWLLGLVTRQTETRSEHDNSPAAVKRTVDHGYDALGRLAWTAHEPTAASADVKSTITYARDTYGSITRRTITDGAGQARITNIEYAPTFSGQPDEKIFPSQVWSPFEPAAHRPSTWFATYPSNGVTFATMDANGVTSRSRFDWLGRITQLVRDGEATAAISYAGRVDTYPPIGKVLNGLTITSVAGGTTKVEVQNARGEILRSGETGFAGLVSVARTYDALGRMDTISRPYTATPSAWSEIIYDALDRKVEEIGPDGATIKHAHTQFSTSSWDADQQPSMTFVDVDGRLMRTINFDGGITIPTTFTYAPFDLLDTVTDAQGHVTKYQHDVRGRLVRRDDPDRGSYTLAYNGHGELREQKHLGTGKLTTFEIDELGRRTARIDDDGVTRMIYDDAAHGIGKLARAESTDGVVTELTYDQAGRATGRTDTIDGVPYSFGRQFDAAGRLAHIDYPAADEQTLRVLRTYTANDEVQKVRYQTGGVTADLLTVAARTVDGYLDAGTLGNGVTLRNLYYPETGRLKRLTALGPTQVLQNLDYAYHDSGLVQSRIDYVEGRYERFLYDGARRLTTWSVDSPEMEVTTTYGYDAVGNMTQVKRGGAITETFTYGKPDGSQPHTLATHTVGGSTMSYAHDTRGRQITGPARTVTFREDDQPRTITRDGKTYQYAYDAFGQRVKQVGPEGTTIYIGELYEQRVEGGNTKHVYLVNGPDGRLAQIVRNGGAPVINYLLTDQLGSTAAVVGAAGQLLEQAFYEPFGLRITQAGTVAPLTGDVHDGFTGHEHDADHLIHMRGRMYDPFSKRFLSADPIVSVPAFGQAWNPYTYVGNSPLNITDPTGYRWNNEWSCLNVPGGCIDAGSTGTSTPPTPPPPPSNTSEGSQHAMDGFMAGSEAHMNGGADVARSDGAGGRSAEATTRGLVLDDTDSTAAVDPDDPFPNAIVDDGGELAVIDVDGVMTLVPKQERPFFEKLHQLIERAENHRHVVVGDPFVVPGMSPLAVSSQLGQVSAPMMHGPGIASLYDFQGIGDWLNHHFHLDGFGRPSITTAYPTEFSAVPAEFLQQVEESVNHHGHKTASGGNMD